MARMDGFSTGLVTAACFKDHCPDEFKVLSAFFGTSRYTCIHLDVLPRDIISLSLKIEFLDP